MTTIAMEISQIIQTSFLIYIFENFESKILLHTVINIIYKPQFHPNAYN